MKFDLSLIKKHPIAAGGAVLGAALVIFMATRGGGGGSSAASSSGGVDPNLQFQTAASMAATSSQQSFQLAYLNAQLAGQGQMAEMSYNLQMYQAQQDAALNTMGLQVQQELAHYTGNLQAQMQTATYNYQLASQQSSEANQLGMLNVQTGAMLDMAHTQAAQNMFVISTNADLQKSLAQMQADVTMQAQSLNYKLGSKQSDNNLLGNIFGGLMGAFF